MAPLIGPAIQRAVLKYLDAAAIDPDVLSEHEGVGVVGEFERAFAEVVDARFAVATASGTAALITILRALGVAPGGEVIVSSYGWGSTVGAVLAIGAVPRFADIDPGTACLNPESVEQMITNRTSAILVTHMFGNPADAVALRQVADAHELRLVFDAAQAMGATVNGRALGAFGDAVAWSCGRHKLPYVGEGGVATTNDSMVAEAMIVASQHPSRGHRFVLHPELRPLVDEMSLSLRMHPLAAVIGSAQLPELSNFVAHRRALCESLQKRLETLPGVRVVAASKPAQSAWYAFSIIADIPGTDAEDLAQALRDASAPVARGPVRVPIHARPRFDGAYDHLELPATWRQCAGELVIESDTRWLGASEREVADIGDIFERVVPAVDGSFRLQSQVS